MEDVRSCHSMHSVRSTRSYLASRPTSDISFIDDEEKAKKAGNGHYRGGTQSNYAKGGGGDYLKVEGGAYRVQRSVSSGSGSLSQGVGVRREPGKVPSHVHSSDAATQSVESTCTQTDETCLGPQFPAMGPPMAPSSPLPPVLVENSLGLEFGRVGSSLGTHVAYTRATSPTPPQYNQYNQQIQPQCYHPAPFPYDPNYYHTYLNPMVSAGMDMGYQYDIVVRRPSMGGQEVGLSVPIPNPSDPNQRRPSTGGGVHPMPHLYSHPPHLTAPHSLPGSFDSAQGPPVTPQYTPHPQPLSPRHLHSLSTSPMVNQSNTNNAPVSASPTPPSEPTPAETSKPIPIPAADIPKLIHETSI